MYSLVIAEDEFTTRRALVNMIRWNEIGFQVDGEFSDGRGLLDYLKSNTPDVILTDIRMTQIGGLEIAHLVSEQNLPIQIVFLSGHKEFSYAQKAVEYHVTQYLLKPIDISKLKEIFQNIRRKLDEQNAKEDILQSQREHYNKLINYEKQQFVTDAYFGALKNQKQIEKRLSLIRNAADNGETARQFFVKVIIKNDSRYQEFLENYGRQELQEQLVHILEYFDEQLEFYPISWNDTEAGEPFIIGVFWETEKAEKNAYRPEIVEKSIYNLMDIKGNVDIFHKLNSPEELACYAEKIGMNESENCMNQDMEYLQLLQDQKKLLYSYLIQNCIDSGVELADTLVTNFLRGGVAFAQRQSIYTVTKLLDEIAGKDLIVWNQLYEKCMNSLPLLQGDELRRWMKNCIRLLADYIYHQIDSKKNTSIEKIMNYLQEHYSEDITLNTVAESVFLNPVYISRLIKEQTGRNYTDLIMEMRIEQAVNFLENTDMFVYEIAEKVGYNNLKYFYKVFRKVKGKSPSDYRPASREH